MKKNLIYVLVGAMTFACCPENFCLDCENSQNTVVQDTTKERDNTDVAIDTARVNITATEMVMQAIVKNYDVGSADAHNTRIIVSLPAETEIRSFEAVTDKSQNLNWKQCKGVIYVNPVHLTRCTKDTVAFANYVKIRLVTGRTTANAEYEQFSIYAFDALNDINTYNNYWHWGKERDTTCTKVPLN